MTKEKKRTLIITEAAFLILNIAALAVYYPFFLSWSNTAMVIICPIIATLAASGLGVNAVLASGKSPSKLRIALSAVITMAVFYGLQCSICLILNNTLDIGKKLAAYDSNEFAICCSYIVVFLVIAALLILFFKGLYGKKSAVTTGIISVCAVCIFGLFCFRIMLPTQWFYPVYRVFVSQGGVETEEENLSYAFQYAAVKIQQTDNISDNESFSISLAKNEREGCQLSVAAKKDMQIAVKVGDFTDKKGNTMKSSVYREAYIDVPFKGSMFSDYFPDGLIPYDEKTPVTIEKNLNQTFYIETVSSADTPAGIYTAPVELLYNEEVIAETSVTAEVWNFSLPEESALETAVGLTGEIFNLAAGLENSTYGINTWLTFYDGSIELTEDQRNVYKEYYDYLLEHKLCANHLPYDILDERADTYMSDPRVTAFCIPYPEDDEKLLAYYEKVNSNPEWAEKAYFYPVDEPTNTQGRIESFTERTARLAELCPGYHMVSPFTSATQITDMDGNTMPVYLFEEDKCDILCSIIDAQGRDEGFPEWLADRQSKGDRAWWYVCCAPSDDSGYCNLFTYQNAVKHRMMFWQNFAADYTGFLYYATCNLWEYADPWTNSITFAEAFVNNTGADQAGDGLLLYPGPPVGEDGPVGSIRLKCVTDGIDDFDYLTLAAEKLGEEKAKEYVSRISTSFTEYSLDPEELYNVRNELGEALSE